MPSSSAFSISSWFSVYDGTVDETLAVGDGRAAPLLQELDDPRRAALGQRRGPLAPQRPRVVEELAGDAPLLLAPGGLDRRRTLARREELVARQELLDLHRIVGQRLGRRVDGGQPAADDDDGQAHLHVRHRVALRGAGQLQRHQEIRRRPHAAREAVGQFEHRRASRAHRQRHVVEAERKGTLDVERPAETRAAVQREAVAPLQQQADDLEEVLVPADSDAVLGDAAETRHHPVVERFGQGRRIEDGHERHARAGDGDAGEVFRQRLDLEAVDAHDRVPVVHQEVRQREAGRPHADDQHALARRGRGARLPQVEGIPARQQRVDLEAPGQRQHVLQDPRLGLRNVDRVGLLVDAGLHAVVADPVPGRGDQRIVDADHRQRTQRHAFGAQLVKLGDLLLQRAAGERDAERALLERVRKHRAVGRLLLGQAVRARVLALLVAPDAVVRLVECGDQVHPPVGQREAVALAQVIAGELPGRHAADGGPRERNEVHVIELARGAEQHAPAVVGAPRLRVRRPGRVAQREVEPRGVVRLVLLPAGHRLRERELAVVAGHRAADRRLEFAAQRGAVESSRHVGPVGIHRLALDEQALDRVQRGEFVVARGECPRFGLDPEQRDEEVLELRGERDQQRRLVLGGERSRLAARGREANCKVRVAGGEVRQEQRIDPLGALDRVEIGEGEAIGKRERGVGGGGHGRREGGEMRRGRQTRTGRVGRWRKTRHFTLPPGTGPPAAPLDDRLSLPAAARGRRITYNGEVRSTRRGTLAAVNGRVRSSVRVTRGAAPPQPSEFR